MKADLSAVFFVTIWIVSMSAQINAQLYCPPDAPAELDMCRKIYEEGRRRIRFRICGDILTSFIIYACGFRKWKRRNGKKYPVSFCKYYVLANLGPLQLFFVEIKPGLALQQLFPYES